MPNGSSSRRHRTAWRAIPIIRVMVGAVFFFEGLQKFMYPAVRGPGRFETIGFPMPEVLGYSVGTLETLCGALLIIGLYTRGSALVTATIMIVAIITTKIPVLLGYSFGPFALRDVPFYGFLSMVHEMRTDWAMLLGSVFLLITGAGPWSFDGWRRRHSATRSDL